MRVERRVATPSAPVAQGAGNSIDVGDKVFIPTLQATGEVLNLEYKEGKATEADVQVGNFRMRLPVRRLELRQKASQQPQPQAGGVRVQGRTLGSSGVGMELDLRGERVDDGLRRLDSYLDEAYLDGFPWVRIIHGKGTGAMRDAVRTVFARTSAGQPFAHGAGGRRWRRRHGCLFDERERCPRRGGKLTWELEHFTVISKPCTLGESCRDCSKKRFGVA